MDILYRNGKQDDCRKIAEGIDLASGGILNFLFHNLQENYTPAKLMENLLRNEVGHDSYKNGIVAEYQGEIVGITYSYPAEFHGITAEARTFFPSERLELLADFYNSRVENSFFLDSIYVDEKFRGHKIANRLLELTKQRAKDNGYQQLSLMVMNDNLIARRAYERNHFKLIKHIAVQEHPLIANKGGIYLLASDID